MGVKMLDMTSEVIALPVGAERVDATIRRTVRALMEGRGFSKETLAPLVGMSPATLYRKLSDKDPTPFKASEVAQVADALGVTVAQLYDGLGGTFVPPNNTPDGGESADIAGSYNSSGPPTSSYPVLTLAA